MTQKNRSTIHHFVRHDSKEVRFPIDRHNTERHPEATPIPLIAEKSRAAASKLLNRIDLITALENWLSFVDADEHPDLYAHIAAKFHSEHPLETITAAALCHRYQPAYKATQESKSIAAEVGKWFKTLKEVDILELHALFENRLVEIVSAFWHNCGDQAKKNEISSEFNRTQISPPGNGYFKAPKTRAPQKKLLFLREIDANPIQILHAIHDLDALYAPLQLSVWIPQTQHHYETLHLTSETYFTTLTDPQIIDQIRSDEILALAHSLGTRHIQGVLEQRADHEVHDLVKSSESLSWYTQPFFD